jgi:acyl dehydratase
MKKVIALLLIVFLGSTLTLSAQVVDKKPNEPSEKSTKNRCR